MQHIKKNELKPHLSKYWKTPPDQNASFVAVMEDVLAIYARPYDKDFPVICMDESSIQLIGEVSEPIPAAPSHPELINDGYVRKGVASIFIEVEPLCGKRQCFAGRIDCIDKMRKKAAACNSVRHNRQTKVDWQFKTDDARIKLKRIYPNI